jgi:hypothetical protein
MKSSPVKLLLIRSLMLCGWAPLGFAQALPKEVKVAADEAVELSPFVVEEKPNQGYYASQTLAGGRMRQDIKDLGSSIQVITREFMEDLSVTGVEELFQYTTGTEVGGILGNFTGATDGGSGETNTGDARRNPDGTSRLRGLAAPDRARNFFKTDIPFDSYNTDRIDINRGANSFLFGLGSPSGLTNTGLVKARFRDTNEISTRIGSGGKNPSYRGSVALNRVLIKDTLAVHGALLIDRTQYRQQPTYKDDDRQYAAITYRPFKHADTVITAHVENGKIKGNAPDVLLPQQNLDMFLYDPTIGRISINAYANLQRFAHVEGPTLAQWNALSAADKLIFRVRDTPTATSLANANWGNGAYGLVYDGRNGRLPTFAYTDQYRAVDYAAGDPFFGPGRTTKGAPYSPYHGNLSEVKGTGWLDQGFTDLKTFDFSKEHLGWDNDYYTRDFVNYNIALEQVLWKGRAGFELAFDYQDLYRRDFAAFNFGNAEVIFDIQETLWLPTDPNYRTSGNVAPQRNPNYGRPYLITKASPRTYDSQRAAGRFTGFVKHDFAEKMKRGSWLGKLLGRHTLTVLGDQSTFDEKQIAYNLTSFGTPEPALHIGPPNARQSSNAPRNVPLMAYIGPPQLNAFTDPNFKLSDFTLAPAKYQLRLPTDYSIRKLSWNLGPDATNANFGLDTRANGNESFVEGTFTPLEVPNKNYRLQQTKVTSYAFNGQSFFWDHLLVVNTGYRVDRVKTRLNTEAPLVGLDEIADVSEQNFRLENGNLIKSKSSVFGYGGVLNWPRQWFELPWKANVAVHYNTSENFVPATDRVDQYRRPVPSPTGRSKDYGVSVYLWDNKVVARLNWFQATLAGATASVSDLFNQTNTNIFNHYGLLTADIRRIDANNDNVIDDAILSTIAVDPATGLTSDGLTRAAAAAQMYPNLAKAKAALASIAPHLTDALKGAYNYRQDPDGSSQTQFAGQIADTNDIESRGFEAEITLNPTTNWRIAFNAAKQETILSNIAPALTTLLQNTWLPHLAKYGDLDWNEPVGLISGNNVTQQINDRLLDYFAIKGQDGRPQMEQRKWRFNFITRYQFTEGRFKGFSAGGAIRWEDKYAAGYPIINDPRGIVLPDLRHAHYASPQTSYDLTLGYRRRILGNKDWTVQLNFRNLQNWFGDKYTAIRYQPDGSVARIRFDAPMQMLLTNTIRF